MKLNEVKENPIWFGHLVQSLLSKNKEKLPLLLIFDSKIYVLMAFFLLIDSKLWTKCPNHIGFSFTSSLLCF